MDNSVQSLLDDFDAEIGYNPSLILFWGAIENNVRQKLETQLDHRVPGYDDGLFVLKDIKLLDTEVIIEAAQSFFLRTGKEIILAIAF